MDFLDRLVDDFVQWATDNTAARAMILFGSMARDDHPGDEYSDRDIYIYVTDPDDDQYLGWMRDYAPPWMILQDGKPENRLWLIVYKDSHAVHLSINPVDNLQKLVDEQRLTTDTLRGYRILVDKDGLAAQLPVPTGPTFETPTADQFALTVNSYFYGLMLIAKQIKRGNLWKVQWAYGIQNRFFLTMIEWHAQTVHGVEDTWQRGEFMHEWVDAPTWQALSELFPHFDAEENWQAIFAGIDLFTRLARETATALEYDYPATMIDEITDYLRELQQK